jgi:hypothetical protein
MAVYAFLPSPIQLLCLPTTQLAAPTLGHKSQRSHHFVATGAAVIARQPIEPSGIFMLEALEIDERKVRKTGLVLPSYFGGSRLGIVPKLALAT